MKAARTIHMLAALLKILKNEANRMTRLFICSAASCPPLASHFRRKVNSVYEAEFSYGIYSYGFFLQDASEDFIVPTELVFFRRD